MKTKMLTIFVNNSLENQILWCSLGHMTNPLLTKRLINPLLTKNSYGP